MGKRNVLVALSALILVSIGAFAFYRYQTAHTAQIADGKMGENGVPALEMKFPEPDSAMKKLDALLTENEDLFPLFLAAITKQDEAFSESRKKAHPELIPLLKKAVDLYHESKPIVLDCDLTFPYVIEGCEGETCGQFTQGRIKAAVDVVDGVGSKTVIDRWAEGTKVFDPNDLKMKVFSAGKVRVLKDVLEADGIQSLIPRGAVFSEVGYVGEGLMLGCIGGHLFSFEGGYGNVETLESSKTEDWVNVKTQNGKSGYVLLNQIEETDNASIGE